MDVQVIAYTSKISNGYTNPPEYPEGQRPLSPTSLRLQGGFFLRGGTATAGRRATDGQAPQPAIGCIECCERRKRDTGMLAGQGVRDEKPHVR